MTLSGNGYYTMEKIYVDKLFVVLRNLFGDIFENVQRYRFSIHPSANRSSESLLVRAYLDPLFRLFKQNFSWRSLAGEKRLVKSTVVLRKTRPAVPPPIKVDYLCTPLHLG